MQERPSGIKRHHELGTKCILIPLLLLTCQLFVLAQNTDINDKKLLQQYIQSYGKEIIMFDASNIKQYWIDKNVVARKENFMIILNSTQLYSYQSMPQKIQLANVNEGQDCKIEILSETPDIEFSVLDSKGNVLSSSSKQEDFINLKKTTSTFHIENTPDLAFSLVFSSARNPEITIKTILLSFSKNLNGTYLYPPGVLKINMDNVRASSSTKLTHNDSTSFTLAGKNPSITGVKFVYAYDNSLSSSATIKNTGNTPVKVTLCFSSHNKKHERLNIASYPYKNTKEILKVVHSESNSNSIIIDSFPTVWAKSCYLAINAKEDMADIPNTNILEGRVSDIKTNDNNQVEILLSKPLSKPIEEGETLRLHAVGMSNIYCITKMLQPGEEDLLTGSFQKDETFISSNSESFAKDVYYVKPMILVETLEKDKESRIMVSNFTVSF